MKRGGDKEHCFMLTYLTEGANATILPSLSPLLFMLGDIINRKSGTPTLLC